MLARQGLQPCIDHYLRIGQQRGKLRCVALVVEDGGFERRLDLGEDPRRDRGGEMAKKQGSYQGASLSKPR